MILKGKITGHPLAECCVEFLPKMTQYSHSALLPAEFCSVFLIFFDWLVKASEIASEEVVLLPNFIYLTYSHFICI